MKSICDRNNNPKLLRGFKSKNLESGTFIYFITKLVIFFSKQGKRKGDKLLDYVDSMKKLKIKEKKTRPLKTIRFNDSKMSEKKVSVKSHTKHR